MKKDIGFWNEQGEYIPDIQEVSEVEMDKEIIIDGVDVAGCEYILNNKIKGKQHCPNKSMPYAKETSCVCRKSIDTPYNFCKHNPNCHYKQLKRLEQENAELKAENEKLKKCNEELTSDNLNTIQEMDNERRRVEELKEENERLKEILQEINAIAEKEIYMKQNSSMDRILDLITKAEEEWK